MSIEPSLNFTNVDRIQRRGGYDIYRTQVSIKTLYDLLKNGVVQYSWKYQRGVKSRHKLDENEPQYAEETLFKITHKDLEIKQSRADEIAAKFLLNELYSCTLVWNIRRSGDGWREPEFDSEKRTVRFFVNQISIPDSAHRHLAFYTLYKWSKNPDDIPNDVPIGTDGRKIDQGTLVEKLELFDATDINFSSVLVEIRTLPIEKEGHIFDEYNEEGKKTSKSKAADIHPTKDVTRRTWKKLELACDIFHKDEIEIQSNSINKNNRKLTTASTITAALKQFEKELLTYEEEAPGKYDDLINFFSKFFEEWSHHITEFEHMASGKARQKSREESIALENIFFFPMFKLAFRLWKYYENSGKNWKNENDWKKALANIAGDSSHNDPSNQNRKLKILDKRNPEWVGIIMVTKFDKQGNKKNSINNTATSRASAYDHLLRVSKLPFSL